MHYFYKFHRLWDNEVFLVFYFFFNCNKTLLSSPFLYLTPLLSLTPFLSSHLPLSSPLSYPSPLCYPSPLSSLLPFSSLTPFLILSLPPSSRPLPISPLLSTLLLSSVLSHSLSYRNDLSLLLFISDDNVIGENVLDLMKPFREKKKKTDKKCKKVWSTS